MAGCLSWLKDRSLAALMARKQNVRSHARAISVAAGLAAHRRRAIRVEIDRQVARAVPFREACSALMRAASEIPEDRRGGV